MGRLYTIINAYMLHIGDSVCAFEAEYLSFVCFILTKEASRQLRWRNDTTGCVNCKLFLLCRCVQFICHAYKSSMSVHPSYLINVTKRKLISIMLCSERLTWCARKQSWLPHIFCLNIEGNRENLTDTSWSVGPRNYRDNYYSRLGMRL